MATFIVKPKPDEDFYLMWSTIVDAPTYFGPCKKLKKWYRAVHPFEADAVLADERFARADETGTSAKMDPPWYAWDEETFIVEQRGLVRREDLKELCELIHEGKPYPHLLHPFGDGRIVTWDEDGKTKIIKGREDA